MADYKFQIPISSDSWNTYTNTDLTIIVNDELITFYLSDDEDKHIRFERSELSTLVKFLKHNQDPDATINLEINLEDDKWNKYSNYKINFCIYDDFLEFTVNPESFEDEDETSSRELRFSSKTFLNVLSFIVK